MTRMTRMTLAEYLQEQYPSLKGEPGYDFAVELRSLWTSQRDGPSRTTIYVLLDGSQIQVDFVSRSLTVVVDPYSPTTSKLA